MTAGAESSPYRAPQAQIHAPDALGDVQYVGFWWRVLAWTIDQMLIAFATLAFQTLAVLGLAAALEIEPSFASSLLAFVVPFLIGPIYFISCWHQLSASLGHLAVGAMLRDAQTGEDLTWLQCAVRYLACLVSWLPFGLGFAWVGIDERKQGWHDKIAGTVVVRVRGREERRV